MNRQSISPQFNAKMNVWALGLIMCICLLGACSAPGQGLDNAEEAEPSATEPAPPVDQATETGLPAYETNILFEGTAGGGARDIGINLIQTRDGGYALLGYTASFGAGGEDIYLLRLDENGDLLWSQTYGGQGKDNGWDLLQTEDGGFAILGFSDSFSFGDLDMYLVRTDALGAELWSQTYGGAADEHGWALAPNGDDGFALAGQTSSYGEGERDAYLVNVDGEGEEIWAQSYGGDDTDRIFSIAASKDGGYVLAGITNSFGAGSRDAYIVKVNGDGEDEWDLVIGEEQDDVAHAISATQDGGTIVTGYTRSFGAANYDTLLIKVNAAGEVEWQRVFGGDREDRTISGEQSADGGYILGGYTQSYGAGGWDAYLVKTDASGEQEWRETFGGNVEDKAYTVMQTQEGNYLLVGHTYSSGEGRGDVYYLMFEGQ